MSNRHLARTIAMQSLYQWDFGGKTNESVDDIIGNNLREFAPDFDDKGFVADLVNNTVGKIKETPVVKDGQVTVAKIMKVCGSFDHRVIDGAEGANFLYNIKKLFEVDHGQL